MPSNPTYRKVNPADAPILILALTSATLTRGQMYDAASTVLAQRLSQVAGVGQVTVGGGALPAVRVELDPDKLAARGIALDVVRTAINSTNAHRPKGVVEKCTFCIQRTRAGRYPACVEICPVGARKFGNLLDPKSEIRAVLESKRVFILKEDLNTQPKFFYFFGI